jgi:hypothetical protein
VEAFGVKFSDGKGVTVSDDVAARLKGNPFFRVSKESPEKPVEEGLKASHNGGGRFVIKNGAETIKDGLTKEDAAVFNALSDEDKAEYVKA